MMTLLVTLSNLSFHDAVSQSHHFGCSDERKLHLYLQSSVPELVALGILDISDYRHITSKGKIRVLQHLSSFLWRCYA